MMRKKYLRQMDHLDVKLDSLSSLLASHSDTQLATSLTPGAWSPAQLLFHLRKSEEVSFLYVKKKLSFDPEVPKVGIKAKVFSTLLGLALKSPIKLKAPAAVGSNVMPADIHAKDQIIAWKDQRVALRLYLQDLAEKWFDKVVYRHPLAGRLTIGQMLTSFDLHFDRHRKQIIQQLPKKSGE